MKRQYQFRIEEIDSEYRIQRRWIGSWFDSIFNRTWDYVLDSDFNVWVTNRFTTAELKMNSLIREDIKYCNNYYSKPIYHYPESNT